MPPAGASGFSPRRELCRAQPTPAAPVPPLVQNPLRALLLLLGGREEDVVEDQPVAGGVLEARQVGRRVPHHVLVVLGVVTAQEGEGAASELPVQVLHLVGAL